ncbi:hypothetical protein C8F04DRAFT_1195894 [Mycena alexandri]|uniref:Histone-lysine N-methyltransferase, H3 lysine-79 specific n=1 Tax=Mycena alexandri TaxID=1745969 RepID=A0AAD6WRM4_9AGAR|nr:hypothetical protein C8F04DRAFT_1195894 [Mycena alexandri]
MPSSAVPSRKPKRRDSVVQHQRQALSGSKTFGEVGPELLGLLNLSELLSPTDLMLDLGAGIGHPAMCNMVSYEIGLAPSWIAGTLFRAVARKCRDNGYPISHHAFIQADMMVDPSVARAISCAKVILLNNMVYEPDLMEWISAALLKYAPPSTHIFVTKRLDNAAQSSTVSQNTCKSSNISLSLNRLPDIVSRPRWAHQEITVSHYVVPGNRPSIPSFWPDGTESSAWQPTDPPHETSCTIHFSHFYFSVPHTIAGKSKLYHHRDGSGGEERLHTENDIPRWGHAKMLKGGGAAKERALQRQRRKDHDYSCTKRADILTVHVFYLDEEIKLMGSSLKVRRVEATREWNSGG